MDLHGIFMDLLNHMVFVHQSAHMFLTLETGNREVDRAKDSPRAPCLRNQWNGEKHVELKYLNCPAIKISKYIQQPVRG